MIASQRLRSAAALAWRAAAVCVAATAVVMLVEAPSDRFGPSEPPTAPAKAGPVEKPAADLPPVRETQYPAIGAYPLFYPTRAPWTPPPPEPPPPVAAAPSTLSGYNLVGIVVSGDTRTALIREQSQKVVRLSEGQEIDGWTLKTITPDRLYFSAGETTYEMARPKPSEIK